MAHQYFTSKINDDSKSVSIKLKYRGETISLRQECASIEECKMVIVSSMVSYLQNEIDDFFISSISANGGKVEKWLDHPTWMKMSNLYISRNLRDLPGSVIRSYRELEGLIPREVDDRNGRPKNPKYFLLYEHLNWLRDFSMTIIELCNRIKPIELAA